ncbi:hypothetical protein [Sediminibacterium ginsengisoli]|uniref:DUF4890 domain-containing protein n=1 Tax=Sediminibacterium ginsengisoli TaxID=413434 RepID=A0A1T4RLA0_9BACT|nr:hypothetical protein [Sediminibacterium ginsengisoli]SKA16566.1 hypothetical protein SAMN04488132_11329 [Sediminibacterium ginsengisoli]
MKKYFLFLLIGATIGLTASAQDGRQAKRSPEQLAEIQTGQLKKKITLTADQENKVKEIELEYAKNLQALKNDGTDRKSRLGKAKEIQDKKDNSLKSVLDEKQYAAYLEQKESRKDKLMEKRKERKGRR